MEVLSNEGKHILEKYNLFLTREEKEESIIKSSSKVTLEDVTKLFEIQGVTGEKDLVKQLVCLAANKKHFGLEGPSGSGKTFIMDKLIKILPNVYTLNQTSGLGLFYDSKEINNSQFIYIPELQKTTIKKDNSLIEIIKDITEGKNATRIKTNSSHNGTEKQEIKSDLTLMYTLAHENNYKPDKELSRRFIQLKTDNSEKHIREILQSKANNRMSSPQSKVKEEYLKSKIKNHLKICLNNNYEIIDPFSKSIFQQFPATRESITKARNYSSLVDGYVKFNYSNHIQITVGKTNYLLINIQDHEEINRIQNNIIQIDDSFMQQAKENIKQTYPYSFEKWFSKQI